MATISIEEILDEYGFKVEGELTYNSRGKDLYKISKDGKTFVAELASANSEKEIVRAARNLREIGKHSNIASIEEIVGSVDDKVLIREFAPGTCIQSFVSKNGNFNQKDCQKIILDVCSGISYAHSKGIIHRDISPANIVVSNDYNSVKIIDFGLSDEVYTTTTSSFNLGYASPEIIGMKELDFRSDIYSIGATLYMMLKGNSPFEIVQKHSFQDRPKIMEKIQRNPEIEVDFDGINIEYKNIILKCIAYDPNDRYQNIDELEKDIKKCFNENEETEEKEKSRKKSKQERKRLIEEEKKRREEENRIKKEETTQATFNEGLYHKSDSIEEFSLSSSWLNANEEFDHNEILTKLEDEYTTREDLKKIIRSPAYLYCIIEQFDDKTEVLKNLDNLVENINYLSTIAFFDDMINSSNSLLYVYNNDFYDSEPMFIINKKNDIISEVYEIDYELLTTGDIVKEGLLSPIDLPGFLIALSKYNINENDDLWVIRDNDTILAYSGIKNISLENKKESFKGIVDLAKEYVRQNINC